MLPPYGPPGNGTITGVTAGTGLSGGGVSGAVTLNIANTGVDADSYGNVACTLFLDINAQGQITSASLVPITPGNIGAIENAAGVIAEENIASQAVSAIKLAPGIGWFGFPLGRNGAGPVTLTGAKVGDTVFCIGILSAGPGQSRNASNLFENTISVADQIQQLSATDQSLTGFLVILNRAGV